MTARFDEYGDLWVEINIATIATGVEVMNIARSVSAEVPGYFTAVTEMNLTKYIQDQITAMTGACG